MGGYRSCFQVSFFFLFFSETLAQVNWKVQEFVCCTIYHNKIDQKPLVDIFVSVRNAVAGIIVVIVYYKCNAYTGLDH